MQGKWYTVTVITKEGLAVKKITFEVNEEMLARAESVFDRIGLDTETALKMFLKKVSNEGSIAFLLSTDEPAVAATPVPMSEADAERGITKSIAKRMFAQRGYVTAKEVRYSKRNKATRNFWQNFEADLFCDDITIILNDQLSRVLYLFDIPANSIHPDAVVRRADMPDMVDLQICGGDPTFTDTKSGIRFDRFLKADISY